MKVMVLDAHQLSSIKSLLKLRSERQTGYLREFSIVRIISNYETYEDLIGALDAAEHKLGFFALHKGLKRLIPLIERGIISRGLWATKNVLVASNFLRSSRLEPKPGDIGTIIAFHDDMQPVLREGNTAYTHYSTVNPTFICGVTIKIR